MPSPFEGVTKVEFEHIPAFILDFVKNKAELYVEHEPEAARTLRVPELIDDILFVIEEIEDPEDKISQLFVVWTNLISALARIDVLSAARKHQG